MTARRRGARSGLTPNHLFSRAAGTVRRPSAARRLPESAERLATPAELKSLSLS